MTLSLARPSGALLGSRLPAPGWRTRFAPAPTGFLHLGHLVNLVYVWGLARAFNGRVVLRVEDHDLTRCRPEYEDALFEDLEWLGFTPDEGAVALFRAGPTRFRQSDNTNAYLRALHDLELRGLAYPCTCSRRDVLRAAGGSVPGAEPCYPGTCRESPQPADSTRARRVRMPGRTITFNDLRLGVQEQTPVSQCGDVLVRDRFGHWTYQFGVVVDDHAQGIDVVIRGEDLLSSTGRQLLLAEDIGRETPPLFLHHPLLVHADGRKLSKASSDTSLRELRVGGASAAALIGEAAARAGLLSSPRPVAAEDVVSLFV